MMTLHRQAGAVHGAASHKGASAGSLPVVKFFNRSTWDKCWIPESTDGDGQVMGPQQPLHMDSFCFFLLFCVLGT